MYKKNFVIAVVCMVIIGCCVGGGAVYFLHTIQTQEQESAEAMARLEKNIKEANEKAKEAHSDTDKANKSASDAEKEAEKYKRQLESFKKEETPESTPIPIATPEPVPTVVETPIDSIDNSVFSDAQEPITQNSLFYFGTYGGESIAWCVLQDDGDRVLLVTEYCIDAQPYYYYEDEDNIDYADFNDGEEYEEYIDGLDIPEITWETSELREFCNDTFYNASFTDVERQRIIPTSVETNDSSSTTDNVFILSGDEWDTYCTDPDLRIGYPTTYAISQGILVNDGMFNTSSIGKCSYWVRGASDSHGDPDCYADWIDVHGRWRYNNSINDTYMGVRPAIWITK